MPGRGTDKHLPLTYSHIDHGSGLFRSGGLARRPLTWSSRATYGQSFLDLASALASCPGCRCCMLNPEHAYAPMGPCWTPPTWGGGPNRAVHCHRHHLLWLWKCWLLILGFRGVRVGPLKEKVVLICGQLPLTSGGRLHLSAICVDPI